MSSRVTYNRTHYDDLMSIKVQVLRLLKQNRISALPQGFPFHYVRDAHGRLSQSMYYTSYEFRQPLNGSEQNSKLQYATFAFIAPSPRAGLQMMEWKIMAPDRQSAYYTNHPGTMISHVQVDLLAMQTHFGLRFMTDSRIIQEALAIALEIGVLITIEVARNDLQTRRYLRRPGIQFVPGQIIFRATDHHGSSEVVYVYQQ